MYQCLRNMWLSITLKRKLGLYTAMVIMIMAFSVIFNIKVMDFAVDGFSEILDDNARCHDFQEAMDMEKDAFEAYVRERSVEKRESYVVACVRTERCMRSLPFDYEKIGEERYAQTWNIKNAYETYSKKREEIFQMDRKSAGFIDQLYTVYSMQNYLEGYARSLVQVTLKSGNLAYQEKVPEFKRIPYIVMLFSAAMMIVAIGLTKVLANTLLNPIVKLAHSSRKIAANDFSEEDLVIENRDEVGELVSAFNKMKHATQGYIKTLETNNEMAERLHKEEIEHVEMEKQLDSARLELLKSQINPHFLFNTLNMIGCMAKLEEASTTEKMIYSMGNLFRYNLKTSEQFIPLEQELKVVEDYVYIQQMRFGERVQYTSSIEVDGGKVIIPAFTLQPVVENAIIHGLSRNEQGGRIHIRIWEKDSIVTISVTDTGVGMGEEKRKELEDALKRRKTAKVGIGLGNIYKRIYLLYEKGEMHIYSKETCGTIIQMMIPQDVISKGGE